MKRFTLYLLTPVVLVSVFIASCTESQRANTDCDTLSIVSGQAHDVVAYHTKTGKFLGKFIFVKTKDGKILAAKSKDGWQIVDCEGALEVLIADLELARQQKQNP